MKVSTIKALSKLKDHDKEFKILFHHGSMELEVYKPNKIDKQKPHIRDEIYIVIAGSGTFYNDGNRQPFEQGDFLFVPAGVEHRFEDFTEDFSTWVIFYGPEGGEAV